MVFVQTMLYGSIIIAFGEHLMYEVHLGCVILLGCGFDFHENSLSGTPAGRAQVKDRLASCRIHFVHLKLKNERLRGKKKQSGYELPTSSSKC